MVEHEVVIQATLEGEEEVSAGFRRMGDSGLSMSRQIRSMSSEIAVLGSSAVAVGKLGESFGVLSEEQAGVIREMGSMTALFGTVVRGLSYVADASKGLALAEKARGAAHAFADTMAAGVHKIAGTVVGALHAIASSSVMVTLAEKARAVAHAIANAVASLGVAVPIMIAAAAAAAVGIAAYTGAIKIPGLAEGAVVYKPTYALISEREPEAVIPLSKLIEREHTTKTEGSVTVYIQNPTFRSRSDADYLVDRLKRMGKI